LQPFPRCECKQQQNEFTEWALLEPSPRRSPVAGSGSIAVRCAAHELVKCGTKPTLDFSTSLAQHSLALAADLLPLRSIHHQSSH
jgi:hypothetical protein